MFLFTIYIIMHHEHKDKRNKGGMELQGMGAPCHNVCTVFGILGEHMLLCPHWPDSYAYAIIIIIIIIIMYVRICNHTV